MQILIEGGDGAGKTTLAESLAKATGFKYYKFPTKGSSFEQVIMNPKASDRDKSAAAILDFKYNGPNFGEDAILDRGFISTMIYQDAAAASSCMSWLAYHRNIEAITHYLILDVDPKVGRARERQKNTMSAEGASIYAKYIKAYTTLSLRLQYEEVIKIQKLVGVTYVEEAPTRNLNPELIIEDLWVAVGYSTPEYKVKLLQTTHLKEEQAHEEVLAWLGLEDRTTQSSGDKLDGGDKVDSDGGEDPAEGTYTIVSDSNPGAVPGAYGEDSPF